MEEIHRQLAEAFHLYGDIGKFGTGFFRIQKELQDSPELRLTVETRYGVTRGGLNVIAQSARQRNRQDTDQDTTQIAGEKTFFAAREITEHEKILLMMLKYEMTQAEKLLSLDLKHKPGFRALYLDPALNDGLIEMTIPDKPNSRYQKYRLTEKGRQMKTTYNEQRPAPS